MLLEVGMVVQMVMRERRENAEAERATGNAEEAELGEKEDLP